ncbi:MAG: filamentous hemagglutinin [Betaproteobacteria bacterium HGW-Betaproteobacteria-16]|nr:MAG: filamentous hemagglutinin [Betaproteobacteria bacterium HGW-Betaproteobacteria-16]
MNRIHRSIWNEQTATFVAVAENTRSAGRQVASIATPDSSSVAGGRFGLNALAASLMMACGITAFAQPVGGVVSAGSATIGGTPGAMVITQTTSNVAINWQSFGIQAGESVQFVQPGTGSVAMNRVTGPDPSNILGSLSANGKVFLVNPNGILFGLGASVNVGGLVASTLAISDADFMANNYRFSGAGTGTVVNEGVINAADGGYVALLGGTVSNQGDIIARFGTVALAAGDAMTLDMAGDQLLSVTVDEGVVNALAENGGLIQADGGRVLMTTQAAGSLLANAVNNTGVIQAQTILNDEGTIRLVGGMDTGTVNVTGTLDASAPGGDGGFIETSAARVEVASTASVTTLAPTGETGAWLIGSQGFSVGGTSADNISGPTLEALLVVNSVTISTATDADGEIVRRLPLTDLLSPTGGGDIDVDDKLEWVASSTPTTLTLLAGGDVNINAPITATNGNLAVCCGRDVNVALGADITTTNGSVLLGAGRDIDLRGALTTTNGNVTMCAANNLTIGGEITVTHTTSIVPEQSLGLPLGLVLAAGYGAGAPGADGGTVVFAPLAPPATVTNAPTTIIYNPVEYTTPTDYAVNIIGAAPVQQMLVFAQAEDKVADGTTTATISPMLQGNPVGDVNLVAGSGSSADFESAAAGADRTIILTGYSLSGADAGQYALVVPCCGPAVARTSATIRVASAPGVPAPAAPPPAARPPSPAPQPSAPPPSVTAPPDMSSPQEAATLPSVLTPYTSPSLVTQGYVLTVSPAAPMPHATLVVEGPAMPEEQPVAAPVAMPLAKPIAPPEVYRAPVRRPKPERN